MKKVLLLLLICIWGANLSARETCFRMLFGERKSPVTYEDSVLDLIKFPGILLTIIGYSTFSMGQTTATFSDCWGGPLVGEKEKERLFFLVLNGKALRGELPRRQGEFAGVAVTAFGCDNSREAFFEETNRNHTKIFREKEYGLSYAVRINRLLDKTGTCGRNGLRRFITALDREFTARYPAFPRLPENTSDRDY